VGLESNASELVLHVEQTVRAQNDDMVQAFSSDRGMKNRRSLLLDPTAHLALQCNQLLFSAAFSASSWLLGLPLPVHSWADPKEAHAKNRADLSDR
jgi:hypothetical protein